MDGFGSMTSAFGRLPDAFPPDPATRQHLASWYTPGLSDALGDRLLMFDNTTASPLELLRFKPEFSRTPGFEEALRQRVDELASFEHEGLGAVRAIRHLGDRDGLALVSDQVPGRRLSEMLGEIQGASLAIDLIRQLTPVLAALHERGIAHGALTPNRIVIAPEGRIVLIEHVLGSALDSLKMSCGWMRTQLGLAVPTGDGHMPLDPRSDVVQLGFIALSLASGQRLDAAAYPEEVADIFNAAVAAGAMPPALRRWLERALHLAWPPFASAFEALAALEELPEGQDRPQPSFPKLPPRPATAEFPREPVNNVVSIRLFPKEPESGPPRPFVPPPSPPGPEPQRFTSEPREHTPAYPAAPLIPVEAPSAPFFPDESDLPLRPPEASRLIADEFSRRTASMLAPAAPAPVTDQPPPAPGPQAGPAGFFNPERTQEPRRIPFVKWLIAGVIAVAVVEGVIISGLLTRDDTTPPPAVEHATPDATAPEQAGASEATAPETRGAATRSTTRGAANRSGAASGAATAPGGRVGSVRFTSPIALEVFENGTRLGSTSGALTLASGRHTLTLVNDALGYKATQRVDVVAGRGTVRTITVPRGRLSINATPWALVSIDGKPAGETPLANLSVPIGTHEIHFRHPLLGERRETAIVKVDGVTRVHANLNR